MGEEPIMPLRLEEITNLILSPLRVKVREDYSVKGGVPQPLVDIFLTGWGDKAKICFGPVRVTCAQIAFKDIFGFVDET